MKIAYLFWLSCLCFVACKNDKDTPRPTSQPNFATVDKLIQDNLGVFRGNVVVLLSQNGKLLYQKQIGIYTESSPLNIASASKWVSGAVLMALVDEGKLSLNDSLGRYLPIFTKYQKGSVSIRQLFSHTSGFPSDSPQGFEDRRDITLAQAVDSIAAKVSLLSKPGTSFRYGSVGMHIAGRVAEVVSGKTWQALFEEKIATPCLMTTATYSPLNPKNPLIAGGVVCSAKELLNFVEMFANKGTFNNKRVLSQNAIDVLVADQTAGATIDYTPYIGGNAYTPTGLLNPVRYGIGVWRDVLSSTGESIEVTSPGAFGTHPWVNRQQNTAGVIFTFSKWLETKEVSLQIRAAIRNELK